MQTLPVPTLPGKKCTRCGDVKPLSDFWPIHSKPGKYREWCIVCCKRDDRARYRANPATHNRLCIAWAKANKDKVRASRLRSEAKHGDRIRAKARAEYAEKHREKRAVYRKANAEKIKARNAAYRERNREKISEAGRAYYAANKEAVDARVKLAVSKNRELYKSINKAAKHRRKVRITGNGPVESFKDREIFERDNWVCGLCGEPVDPDLRHPDPQSASLDHRKPIVKGGGHTRANVQLAHLRCNFRKRDRE
jgi:hypothetical protein